MDEADDSGSGSGEVLHRIAAEIGGYDVDVSVIDPEPDSERDPAVDSEMVMAHIADVLADLKNEYVTDAGVGSAADGTAQSTPPYNDNALSVQLDDMPHPKASRGEAVRHAIQLHRNGERPPVAMQPPERNQSEDSA